MKDKNMRFGTFIRSRRLNDSRELTLKDISAELGISLSMLSDIEQGRRKPFDMNRIDRFCNFLHLPPSDRTTMYDLAAKETGSLPSDLDDIMMYSEIGSMARMALRMTNEGIASEEDWKSFIRHLEQKKGASL